MNDSGNYLEKLKSFFPQKKEVLVTFDVLEYTNILRILKKAKMNFHVKSAYTGYGNQPGGRISSLGENTAKQTEYQVYVCKKDYEKASYRIHNARMGALYE